MLNKNVIIKFIQNNFSEEDYKIGEDEIQLNSPFKNDKKFHLGISLQKSSLGLWNDFKPPQDKGNFYSFVSKFKNISYQQAKMKIVEEYLSDIDINIALKDKDLMQSKKLYKYRRIYLPKNTFKILQNGKLTSKYAKPFFDFLHNQRNIEIDTIEKNNISCCVAGNYAGHLIVPFYNENKELVYYLARNLKTKKYKNISNKIAQGKGGGIGYNIFTNEDTIVLTESVWDALRLRDNGVALLSNKITKMQIENLKKHPKKTIIIAGDNFKKDSAGKNGIIQVGQELKMRMPNVDILVFMWEDKFSECKDFSRCNFNIQLEDIIQRSIKFSSFSTFKINLLNKIMKI